MSLFGEVLSHMLCVPSSQVMESRKGYKKERVIKKATLKKAL